MISIMIPAFNLPTKNVAASMGTDTHTHTHKTTTVSLPHSLTANNKSTLHSYEF